MPMNPPELLEWLRDFQGIIGALFGSTLTYYVLRGFSRREEQRAKREAWLVIVGELASYSTFAEALLGPQRTSRNSGELAKAIHSILRMAPVQTFHESSFAALMLEQPAVCRELQRFLLKVRATSSLADTLRYEIVAMANPKKPPNIDRCAGLLEALIVQYRETGALATEVIRLIDKVVFKGKLGDPVAHIPAGHIMQQQLATQKG